MGKVNITTLDGGTPEERTEVLKKFFGLRPDQSFQDIELDETYDETEDE